MPVTFDFGAETEKSGIGVDPHRRGIPVAAGSTATSATSSLVPHFSQTKKFSRSRVVLQHCCTPPEAARASYHARARLQFVRGGR